MGSSLNNRTRAVCEGIWRVHLMIKTLVFPSVVVAHRCDSSTGELEASLCYTDPVSKDQRYGEIIFPTEECWYSSACLMWFLLHFLSGMGSVHLKLTDQITA